MAKPIWTRAFLLGRMVERGVKLTTAKIRAEMRVSKATAKRDMQRLRRLVPQTTPYATLPNCSHGVRIGQRCIDCALSTMQEALKV